MLHSELVDRYLAGSFKLIFKVTTSYVPTRNVWKFYLVHILSKSYDVCLFNINRLSLKWYAIVVLIGISPMTNVVEHLFICSLIIYLLWRNTYSNPLTIFKIDLCVCCCLITTFYIFWIKVPYYTCFECFPQMCGLPFHFIDDFFGSTSFNFYEVQFIFFFFY